MPSVQSVIACVSGQEIVAAVSPQRVVAAVPVEVVPLLAAVERIVARQRSPYECAIVGERKRVGRCIDLGGGSCEPGNDDEATKDVIFGVAADGAANQIALRIVSKSCAAKLVAVAIGMVDDMAGRGSENSVAPVQRAEIQSANIKANGFAYGDDRHALLQNL